MRKHIPILTTSLLTCLFIYVFYRTEKTLVNQMVIALFSRSTYMEIKNTVTSSLPLNNYFVYSLPEGLWVFCTTITSSFFYLEFFNRRWSLAIIPVFLAVSMELFQLLHLTNGRFDWMDIGFSVGFWATALLWTGSSINKKPLFQSYNTNSVTCIFSYAIVYLAHVY